MTDLESRIKILEDALREITRICNPYILQGDHSPVARSLQSVRILAVVREVLKP
jgi:hypothetical protein